MHLYAVQKLHQMSGCAAFVLIFLLLAGLLLLAVLMELHEVTFNLVNLFEKHEIHEFVELLSWTEADFEVSLEVLKKSHKFSYVHLITPNPQIQRK